AHTAMRPLEKIAQRDQAAVRMANHEQRAALAALACQLERGIEIAQVFLEVIAVPAGAGRLPVPSVIEPDAFVAACAEMLDRPVIAPTMIAVAVNEQERTLLRTGHRPDFVIELKAVAGSEET